MKTCHRVVLDESKRKLGDFVTIRKGLGRILLPLFDQFRLETREALS